MQGNSFGDATLLIRVREVDVSHQNELGYRSLSLGHPVGMSNERRLSQYTLKTTIQWRVRRIGWIILLLIDAALWFFALLEFQSGHRTSPVFAIVIGVIAVVGLISRWGLLVPCTIVGAFIGMFSGAINGDSVSTLQGIIAWTIIGALFGAGFDSCFSDELRDRRPH